MEKNEKSGRTNISSNHFLCTFIKWSFHARRWGAARWGGRDIDPVAPGSGFNKRPTIGSSRAPRTERTGRSPLVDHRCGNSNFGRIRREIIFHPDHDRTRRRSTTQIDSCIKKSASLPWPSVFQAWIHPQAVASMGQPFDTRTESARKNRSMLRSHTVTVTICSISCWEINPSPSVS